MTTEHDFIRALRDRLSRHIENQPEYLLEHDGGPEGLKADLILATLIGMDGQTDIEWRIPAVVPYLLRPVRPRLVYERDDTPTAPSIRTARYELQSNWASIRIDYGQYVDVLPADIHPGTDFMVTVALVRYKHRMPR